MDSSGKPRLTTGSDRVYPGMQLQIPTELVTISTPEKPKAPVSKSETNTAAKFVSRMLPVLYENESVAVFNKPAGLACQGGSKIKYSVDTLLAKIDSSDETGYRLVHRLDRGTTGALAVAKSRTAANTLTKAFSDRTVDKEYVAVIRGIPKALQGMITTPLINTGTKTVAVSEDSVDAKQAKSAITKYKTLATGKFNNQDVALISINILTGRKHQIRAHCAQVLGCPVLGDAKYTVGEKEANEVDKYDSGGSGDENSQQISGNMFLHLYRLSIPPDISVKAPFPKSWSDVFKQLNIPFSKKKGSANE
ncbi:hypothetical protein GGI11_003664 [Coemansia sp. RSA 2049]|nr:hypothetical protein GGI11_003664 [Coemansia sp. RSA 2049]KAJ2695386.1 hypothetical protein GGH99_000176 [Coemansia sp. RSA 1285]